MELVYRKKNHYMMTERARMSVVESRGVRACSCGKVPSVPRAEVVDNDACDLLKPLLLKCQLLSCKPALHEKMHTIRSKSLNNITHVACTKTQHSHQLEHDERDGVYLIFAQTSGCPEDDNL